MCDGLGMRYAFLGPFEVTHLNANGFRDYGERFFEGNRCSFTYRRAVNWLISHIGAYNVSSTFDPIPKMHEGDTKDRIAESLEKRVPLEKLKERQKWRDERLMELAMLKKKASE